MKQNEVVSVFDRVFGSDKAQWSKSACGVSLLFVESFLPFCCCWKLISETFQSTWKSKVWTRTHIPILRSAVGSVTLVLDGSLTEVKQPEVVYGV